MELFKVFSRKNPQMSFQRKFSSKHPNSPWDWQVEAEVHIHMITKVKGHAWKAARNKPFL